MLHAKTSLPGDGTMHVNLKRVAFANTRRFHLHAFMQDAQAGALDEVIDSIIPIIETELFGQVSEEKEAHAFVGGCKEAKRLRAYATYQLLAQGVTFRTHMSALLQPVCSDSMTCGQRSMCTAALSPL